MSAIAPRLTILAALAALMLTTVGCSTNTGNGALIGGVGGAAVGGAIGSMSHSRFGEGALIGGAIGALGGAVVGDQMDRQEQERRDAAYDRSYNDRRSYYSEPPRRYDNAPPPGYYEYRRYDDCGPYEYREVRVRQYSY